MVTVIPFFVLVLVIISFLDVGLESLVATELAIILPTALLFAKVALATGVATV